MTAIGDGPDSEWTTAEERVRGEARLRADFARELERALEGRRVNLSGIAALLEADGELKRTWVRMYWEYIGRKVTGQELNKVLRRLEGSEHRMSRRWSKEAGRMQWGFEPKTRK